MNPNMNPNMNPMTAPTIPAARETTEQASALSRWSFRVCLLAFVIAVADIIAIAVFQVTQLPQWAFAAQRVIPLLDVILGALGITLNLVEALRVLRRAEQFDPRETEREEGIQVATDLLRRIRPGCLARVSVPLALTLGVATLLLGLVPLPGYDGSQVNSPNLVQSCTSTGSLAPFHFELDNSASTVAVSWSAAPVETLPGGAPWAAIQPQQGTLKPGQRFQVDVIPNVLVCQFIAQTHGASTFGHTTGHTAGGAYAAAASKVATADGGGATYHVQVTLTGKTHRKTTVALSITRLTPTPTPNPQVVASVDVDATQPCRALPPAGATSGPPLAAFPVTIRNSTLSTSRLDWSLAIAGAAPSNAVPWTLSATSGSLDIGGSTEVQLTSTPDLCRSLTSPATFHVVMSWTTPLPDSVDRAITILPPSWPAPSVTNLSGVIGSRYISSQDRLIFVEYDTGQLSAIDNLSTSPTYRVLGSGYGNPEDVAVTADGKTAFVTERDGAFLRVDLAHADRSAATVLVTDLLTAGQIALDEAHDVGYFVDWGSCGGGEFPAHARLIQVKLDAASPISAVEGKLMCLRQSPIGLAMTSDFRFAYVTEQLGPGSIVERVDISTFERTTITPVSSAPLFFLTWADAQQTSLLVTERDPTNEVWKLDVTGNSSTLQPVEQGVPFRPSSVVLIGTHLYVCSQSAITQYTVSA